MTSQHEQHCHRAIVIIIPSILGGGGGKITAVTVTASSCSSVYSAEEPGCTKQPETFSAEQNEKGVPGISHEQTLTCRCAPLLSLQLTRTRNEPASCAKQERLAVTDMFGYAAKQGWLKRKGEEREG